MKKKMIIKKLKQWYAEEKSRLPIVLGIFTAGAIVIYAAQHPGDKSLFEFLTWTFVGYLMVLIMGLGFKIFLEDDWRNKYEM